METRGLKVNINKTKLMVMGSDPAARPQRGRYQKAVFAAKESEQTQHGVNVVKGGTTRDVQGSEK